MTEPQAYIEVAERSLEAADGALGKGIQEKAAFLAYHAFESTGGAFCRSRGMNYPAGHKRKINTFISAVRKEHFAKQAIHLAIAYNSLRNALLYPLPIGNGQVRRPLEVITEAQTVRLIGRTESLVSRVRPEI